MPGWGLVVVALLAKGTARSQAEHIPCAEQRDWQSCGGSTGGQGTGLLPWHCLRSSPFSGQGGG